MAKMVCLLSLMLLLGCHEADKRYLISGSVTTADYTNERIYLVPLEGATAENVDSAVIVNNQFTFEGTLPSKEQIYILRTRPLLRLKLQELLVVLEPGETTVKLGLESSAKGTPLNNALQSWKEKKAHYDTQIGHYQQVRNGHANSSIDDAREKIDDLKKEFALYNDTFVKENKNIIGHFIDKMTR